MKQEERKFLEVLKNNTQHPIIVEGLNPYIINGAVVISANITCFELGSLSNDKPFWVSKLEKINSIRKFLVIDGVDNISRVEQKKFIWLLENRQDNGYKLDKSVQILIAIEVGNLEKLNQKIKSLCINWKL